MKHFNPRWLLGLAMLAVSMCLPGCSCDDLEGTYTDAENVIKVELKDDNRVYITLGDLGSKAGEYEVDDDRVIIKVDGDTTVLTRKDDGSLDGGMMFGTLKKTDD